MGSMSARSLCYSISRETVRDYWGGVLGVSSHRTPARGYSPEQNSINEFLVHKREIVPQHKFRVHVIHTPKARFDSKETARLATTTRTLPIPESGSSISDESLLICRKTVHNQDNHNRGCCDLSTHRSRSYGSAVIANFDFAPNDPRLLMWGFWGIGPGSRFPPSDDRD